MTAEEEAVSVSASAAHKIDSVAAAGRTVRLSEFEPGLQQECNLAVAVRPDDGMDDTEKVRGR